MIFFPNPHIRVCVCAFLQTGCTLKRMNSCRGRAIFAFYLNAKTHCSILLHRLILPLFCRLVFVCFVLFSCLFGCVVLIEKFFIFRSLQFHATITNNRAIAIYEIMLKHGPRMVCVCVCLHFFLAHVLISLACFCPCMNGILTVISSFVLGGLMMDTVDPAFQIGGEPDESRTIENWLRVE